MSLFSFNPFSSFSSFLFFLGLPLFLFGLASPDCVELLGVPPGCVVLLGVPPGCVVLLGVPPGCVVLLRVPPGCEVLPLPGDTGGESSSIYRIGLPRFLSDVSEPECE